MNDQMLSIERKKAATATNPIQTATPTAPALPGDSSPSSSSGWLDSGFEMGMALTSSKGTDVARAIAMKANPLPHCATIGGEPLMKIAPTTTEMARAKANSLSGFWQAATPA